MLCECSPKSGGSGEWEYLGPAGYDEEYDGDLKCETVCYLTYADDARLKAIQESSQ